MDTLSAEEAAELERCIRRKGRLTRTLVVLPLVVLLAACSVTAVPNATSTAGQAAQTPQSTAAPSTTAPSQAAIPVAVGDDVAIPQRAFDASAIANVARASRAGVVQISTEQEQLANAPGSLAPAGVGTGVVLDQQGHILTNNHVVEAAQRLEVQLTDGRSFPATLVGRDPQTDLAVIQINAPNLTPLPLGDSSKLTVGQWVVAIGNALALEGGPTVTHGVISALGRTQQEPGTAQGVAGPFLFDVIQTSAPINPGNSGGPLIDLSGNVIGVNTLVAGQAEPGVQARGIGFAIAINTAKQIATTLIATGRVVHPFIGIQSQQNTPSLAARLGIPQNAGAVVAAVTPNSPAQKAGVQARDVIITIDGQPIIDESTIPRVLDRHKPGETITLTLVRTDGQHNVQVTLGERPQG